MTEKEYPKKIYLQNEDGAHPDCDTYYGEGMTWCEDKINKDDAEYIRADLVNEFTLHIAEQAVGGVKHSKGDKNPIGAGINGACDRILSRIKELTQGESPLTQTNEDK